MKKLHVYDLGYRYVLRHRKGADEIRFCEDPPKRLISIEANGTSTTFRLSSVTAYDGLPVYVELDATTPTFKDADRQPLTEVPVLG